MSPTTTQQKWTLAFVALRDAYTDFIWFASLCSDHGQHWKFTNIRQANWYPGLMSVALLVHEKYRHVREYLAELAGTGKADNTVHDNARAIKTLLRF